MANRAKQAAMLNIIKRAQRENWLELDAETAFIRIQQQWRNRGYKQGLENLTLRTMEQLIPEGD